MPTRSSPFIVLLVLLLVLAGCGRRAPAPPEDGGNGSPTEPLIHENVRVLSGEARAALAEFSLDTSTDEGHGELRFRSDAAGLDAYEPGHVLVSEPVPGVAPHGFIQIIESRHEEGSEIIFSTVQANLLDVFEQADIVFEQELTEADLADATLNYEGMSLTPVRPDGLESQASGSVSYGFQVEFDEVLIDVDGNPATTDDQLRLDGAFRFSASASAGIDICAVCGDWFTPAVREVYGKVRLEEEISVSMTGELATEFSKSIPVASFDFGTFTVWVGPVPVVFVIDMVISVGASGEFTAHLEARATQSTAVQVGIEYTRDNGWRDLNEFESGFDFPDPQITAAAEARAWLRPQLDVQIYGLAGPYLYAEPYIAADAEMFRTPFWKLNAGIDFGIGFVIDLPIVGKVADYDARLLGFEKTLAEAPNEAPRLTISSPPDGARVPTAQDLSVRVEASDREQRELTVELSGSGGIGAASKTAKGDVNDGRINFGLGCLEPGTYSLRASTTDDGGLTTTVKDHAVIVENVKPTVKISEPDPDQVMAAPGLYIPLSALAHDRTCDERNNAAEQDLIGWQVNGSSQAPGRDLYYLVPPSADPGDSLDVRASYSDGTDEDSDGISLTVRTPPPGWTPADSAVISEPAENQYVRVHDMLDLSGMAYNPASGELTDVTFIWEAKEKDSPDSRYFEIGRGKNTSTEVDPHNWGETGGRFIIRLTVETDSGSASDTVEIGVGHPG